MPKKTPTNPIDEEKLAAAQSEGLATENSEASIASENLDEEAEKGLIAEEAADAEEAVLAELSDIKTDNESAKAASGEEPTIKKASKAKTQLTSKKPNKAVKVRSKKYAEAKAQVEKGKLYNLTEAIELVKKISGTKFDSAVELHLKLTKKKAKGGTESSKGSLHLPHGSGKDKVIIVLDEAKIEAIAKTKKIDFDVAIASPALMPKVAKIAKILGPKGKMPDPKSGTVTDEPKKVIAEINSGRVDYRIDASNNIHQMIGRVSWDGAKLAENTQAVLGMLPKARISAAYLTASMTPSVAVDLSFLK
jgi:large subunit ribosomal protein L1